MSLLHTIAISLDNYRSIAIDAFDKTFPPDDVDPIDETLNGNDEEFKSEDGISYRTHYLTRISSFMGWPNRKLYKNKGQSRQNLWDNFLGKQDNANNKRLIRRAAIMVPLNIISLPFKFIRNILKFGMEFIPLTCSNILFDTATSLQKNINRWAANHAHLPLPILFITLCLSYLLPFFLYSTRVLFELIYLTDRCLLDPYDSLRSAWNYGIDSKFGRPLAYFLSGLSIATTLIMFCFALPIAAKLFAISVGPTIMHVLPTVIDNALIKMANAISPTLTAIGHPLTTIVDTFISSTNIALYYTLPILTPIPALVGASLFFATAIATIGLVVNSYINDFKAWWNYDPNFEKPFHGEGTSSSILDQQFNMLCTLGEKNLSKTNAATALVAPGTSSTHDLSAAPQINAIAPAPTLLPTEPLRKQTTTNTTSAVDKEQIQEEKKPEEEKRSNMSLSK